MVVPGVGLVEAGPPPNRPPPVVGFVAVVVDAGVVDVAPNNEVLGLEPKMLPGVVVVVPVFVVPVPVVPVLTAGVVEDVLLV